MGDMLEERRKEQTKLFKNLKVSVPVLEKLLAEVNDHWCYEDGVYRFYHQSFKVYHLQGWIKKIIAALEGLMPGRKLNNWFMAIMGDGLAKEFERRDNFAWARTTRPIVEAFFHAKYMLEMAVKYGKELDEEPQTLPSGWAGFLYLYDLR